MNPQELANWLDENQEFNCDDGYEQCTQKVFDEIKNVCITTWKNNFEDEEYVNEKLQRIEQIENFNADVMFMLNMFHPILRSYCIHQLSKEAQEYIDRYNKKAYDN